MDRIRLRQRLANAPKLVLLCIAVGCLLLSIAVALVGWQWLRVAGLHSVSGRVTGYGPNYTVVQYQVAGSTHEMHGPLDSKSRAPIGTPITVYYSETDPSQGRAINWLLLGVIPSVISCAGFVFLRAAGKEIRRAG